MTRYFATAQSEDGVLDEALRLLSQLYPAGRSDFSLQSEKHTEEGQTTPFFWKLWLKPDSEAEADASEKRPTVYVTVRKAETSEGAGDGDYWLYFLFDSERLSFCTRHLSRKETLLPLLRPLVRPTESLSVEAVHTLEGRRLLRTYFNYGEEETSPDGSLQAVQLFQEATPELKLYALFDDFGELTLEEIKEALEAGDYDGGVKDGELILSVLTGKTYDTEKKYLSELSKLCGAEVVKKYEDSLLSGYRFYSATYFVDYLDYTLRQLEDYALLKEQETELSKRYKLSAKALSELAGEPASALDYALARFLANEYYSLPQAYEGLSPTRLAEYFRIPLDKLRELVGTDRKDWL